MASKSGKAGDRRDTEGLVNLTELWNVAGRPENRRPGDFRRLAAVVKKLAADAGLKWVGVAGLGTWSSSHLADGYVIYLRDGARPGGARKAKTGGSGRATAGDPSKPDRWEQAVKSAYRSMACRLHPDRGGDVRAMIVVNQFHDLIEEFARAA